MSQQQGASESQDSEHLPTTNNITGDEFESSGDKSTTEQSSSVFLTPEHSAGCPSFIPSPDASPTDLESIVPVRQHSTSPPRKILKQDASGNLPLQPDTWKQSTGLYEPVDESLDPPLSLEKRMGVEERRSSLLSQQQAASLPALSSGSSTRPSVELPPGCFNSPGLSRAQFSAEADSQTITEHVSSTNTLSAPPHLQLSTDFCVDRKISPLSLCHSMSSLSKLHTEDTSSSLPDVLHKEFTPVITADCDDETYRFQCSSPGLYLCSVTGLMFDMKGEGDVVYRTVPWNRRLLVQHHKKPAGPLFDIRCVQQRVSRLHVPHCEISSTAGARVLSVAHVTVDGDVEFIRPQTVTETHVVINITGFSGYGNVKDEDSPPDLVRALVLLFYRPPSDPHPESLINVLLLPKNVCLRDVLHSRTKLNEDEMYIETSPHCKLKPDQLYTLSTCPQDDSVLVQPTEAEFDANSYDNYFPSFQVDLETVMKHIKLILRDSSISDSVWERRVCLSSSGKRKSCEQQALSLPSNKRLSLRRSSFIRRVSGPVLNSLLDKLQKKKVMSDSERESVDAEQTRGDKARAVIDTVRKKGDAASSEMIGFLSELDPFLCEHLVLM